MMTSEMLGTAEMTDAELVAQSVRGDREAFGEIVSRYQSLICSLAFGATGSLGRSEDLAQETFLAAWKQLRQLREPERLRSWLCGIVRNLTRKELRQHGHEPVCVAEAMDAVGDAPAPGPLPSEQTISKEEETLLWHSLERIPETYREPLILFYREHRSVEQVSSALELSEDAVKQRLSRGRKLLQEHVIAFVESALERTSPGRAFTLGVLAALPVFATSASAATIGATVAKGSTVAASSALVMIFNAVLGPIVGVLGAYLGVRASLEATRTPREREFVVRQIKVTLIAVILFMFFLAVCIFAGERFWKSNPLLLVSLGVGVPLAYVLFILGMVLRSNHESRRIREEERQRHPELFLDEHSAQNRRMKEYRSRWTFLGLPLVHVLFGNPAGQKVRPAVGWIAIGDRAIGILFALGGVAIGGVSIGGVSVGLVAVGGGGIGLIAIGGFALGLLAIGGAAVGLLATGGFAVGWTGAEGGFAVAREFALGGHAMAHHGNDQVARDYFARYPWLDLRHPANAFLLNLVWLPMLLFVWQMFRTRKGPRRSRGTIAP